MTDYSYTQSRVLQWLGIILIIAVFAGAYWYFKVYAGYKTNVLSPTGSLTTGLVGYWPFDRASVLGTTALDRSTSKYNGTLVSSPPVANGQVNQALDFDGSADYVTMGNQSNLNFGDTADFSISGWFYRDTFTTADAIVSKRNGVNVGETGYSVDIEATDQLVFRVSDGSNEFRMYTTSTFTTAQWTHFSLVFDQDSAANTKFYINGQAVSTTTGGTITSVGNTATALAFMVGNTALSDAPFDGKIDEIRVYNRVLTATEAQLLYEFSREGSTINSSASQAQGTGRLDSGLAGYWAMDNGSGTSVTDSSTNGNTGTLTGGSSWGTGRIGSAVDLDGTDDYVDMGDLFYSDAFTVCAWVRADVIDANSRNIVVKRNTPGVSAGSNEWTLNASTSGFTFTTWTSASVTALNITGSTVPTTATWYHVCGVEHGNGRTGYIYVNGTQNVSGTQTAALWDTADRVQIGARSATNDNRYWNGLIDEVRVYNRGLSADEVGDLYRLSTPTAVDTGLKGYWSFNGQDVSGTTAYDRSGAGNTGALTGGPTVTPGKVGQALSFDASDDYVAIGSAPVTAAPLTITAWIKPAVSSSGIAVSVLRTASNWNGFYIGFSSGSASCKAISSNVSTGPTLPGTVGAWQFVSCVMDSSTSRTVYLNGVAGTTDTTSSTPASAPNNITIGGARHDSIFDNAFNGGIDDVRIYNRALSAAEIKGLYAAGQSDEVNTGASQPQGGSRLDSGLAGYWKLDDGSGTSTADASVNGNTGTLTNGPTWTTGQIGGAVNFDGNNDYINGGQGLSFALTNNFTLSAWINPSSLHTTGYFGLKNVFLYRGDNSSSTINYLLQVESDTSIVFKKRVGVEAIISYTFTGIPSLTARWSQVTLVVTSGTATLFVDGVKIGTQAIASLGYETGHYLYMGTPINNNGNSSEQFFIGKIDEVRVYNRPLSADEVADLYRLSSPTDTDTGLKGYWSFNGKDVSGTTAYDRSGAGNTGTLTGGPSVTPGKIGQAIDFDGTDDYVTAGDIASVDAVTALTVCAWVKHDSITSDDLIVAKEIISPADGFTLFRDDVGAISGRTDVYSLVVFDSADSGSTRIETSSSSTPLQTWTHVCGTYLANNTNGLNLYVNGVAAADNPVSTAGISAIDAGTNPLTVGMRSDTISMPFDGSIDEVRVYNRVLTAAEITSLYNAGK